MTTGFAERVCAAQSALSKHKLQGLLIQQPVSSLYLSGFQSSNSLILVTKKICQYFTDFRYITKATASIRHMEVLQMQQHSLADIAMRVKKLRIRNLGFEESISYTQYTALRNAIGTEVNIVPAGEIVRSMRLIKSAAETRQIAANQKLNETIFNRALQSVGQGSTERGIRNQILREMIGADCEEAFASIIASGPNSAVPHAVAGPAKVKQRNLLLFDMGVKKHHYHSDMTRTVAVGDSLPAQALEIYEVVKEAQEAALKAVAPGVPCREIDYIARSIIVKAGYGDNFGHGLGHGVGLEIHEGPTVNSKSDAVLQAGMVITIEPGIYIPHFWGVRIEDLVVVTNTGYRNLTSLPKTLQHISL